MDSIVAFTPLRVGNGRWTVAVVAEYSLIARAVSRNFRDNLIFTGFVLIVFLSLGFALWKLYEKKLRLEISEKSLDIINKQLHSEIAERKKPHAADHGHHPLPRK